MCRCSCCGNIIKDDLFSVCDMCGWENDTLQNESSSFSGGANILCLEDYKKYYNIKKDNSITYQSTEFPLLALYLNHKTNYQAEYNDGFFFKKLYGGISYFKLPIVPVYDFSKGAESEYRIGNISSTIELINQIKKYREQSKRTLFFSFYIPHRYYFKRKQLLIHLRDLCKREGFCFVEEIEDLKLQEFTKEQKVYFFLENKNHLVDSQPIKIDVYDDYYFDKTIIYSEKINGKGVIVLNSEKLNLEKHSRKKQVCAFKILISKINKENLPKVIMFDGFDNDISHLYFLLISKTQDRSTDDGSVSYQDKLN